jgi:hypothetical protein
LRRTQAVSPPPDGGYSGANTAEGENALLSLTSGGYNTAVGFFSLSSNAIGTGNTAIGAGALAANSTDEITAVGAGALLSNTTGPFNTATGALALASNTTGNDNTAVGSAALESNITGADNTAVGSAALITNTADDNTAVGFTALFLNAAGSDNTAIGSGALKNNTAGPNNTAVGFHALSADNSGANTAVGALALQTNTDSHNTAVGYSAGSALVSGGFNIYIGEGVNGPATENETVRIGDNLPNDSGASACYVGGIAGQSVNPNGAGQVYIDNTGKLGVFLSSQRFKRDVEPMNRASETILALKPVTFHYKSDAKNTPCFGLIAEDVAKVDSALVVRDKQGQPYSVRYDQVNAMLLNEFLKEHQTVQELKKQVAELTAGLQKVSATLEMSNAAPQTVLNNR